jgi:pimeloyl-ACP methyl ester carboxylesterase
MTGRSPQSLKAIVAGFLPERAKENLKLRRDMLDICRELIAHGEFNDAAAVLGRLVTADHRNSPQVSAEARRMLGLCKQLKRSGMLDEVVSYRDMLERLEIGALDHDYTTPDGVLIRSTEGAEDALVVFTPPGGDFWISINLLHHHLKPFPWHIVYIRDAKRCFHMAGVNGLGEDYAASLEGLRALVSRLGARNTYCIGGSIGGYAALRYGLDLRAKAVLGFSAIASLDPSDWPEGLRPALNPITRIAPHMRADLDDLYRAAADRPRTLLCYGAASEFDLRHTERMRAVGDIIEIPIAGYTDHDAISYMVVKQKMPLIHAWLTGTGDARLD